MGGVGAAAAANTHISERVCARCGGGDSQSEEGRNGEEKGIWRKRKVESLAAETAAARNQEGEMEEEEEEEEGDFDEVENGSRRC